MKKLLLTTAVAAMASTMAMSAHATLLFEETGTIQSWTTLTGGTYRISAAGAEGGGAFVDSTRAFVGGGRGAVVSDQFYFSPGATLSIIVGGRGETCCTTSGGGGGGSFVLLNQLAGPMILLAAGGGGGAGGGDAAGSAGGDGQIDLEGGNGGGPLAGAGGINGSGGAAGAQVRSAPGYFSSIPLGGGGGGGYFRPGGNGGYAGLLDGGYGGGGILAGFLAGDISQNLSGYGGYYAGNGGYGGGGGGTSVGGGGGGGYSGGGGGTQLVSPGCAEYCFATFGGGGGGSFDAGANPTFFAGAQSGDGLVKIDFLYSGMTDPNAPGSVPEPSSWALMILGFGGAGAMLRRRARVMAPSAA